MTHAPFDSVAYLALGSNLGDRFDFMRRAVAMIADTLGISFDPAVDVASLYESHPIAGTPESFNFLNSAIRIHTRRLPRELLQIVHSIEDELGRVRTKHWGPRTIDIDILLIDDCIVDEPGLTIPHPRMHERRFVLEPLCELMPDLIHPAYHRSILDLSRSYLLIGQTTTKIQGPDWVHG